MPISVLRRTLAMTVAAVLLFVGLAPSHAAVVIFKDGYTVKGKIKREGETIFDPASGQSIPIAKGFFMVDDSARRTVFSMRQVQEVLEQDVDNSPDLVVLQQPFVRMNNLRLDSVGEIQEVGPFDVRWDRDFKFFANPGGVTVSRQKMTVLTPHYARVDAGKHRWAMMYLTRELGPDVVRQLLHSHPDLKEKEGRADPLKRQRVFRFLKQVGWYEHAELELDDWLKDAPAQKAKIDEFRNSLQSLKADQLLVEIDRAYKAGRHDWAREKIEKFPRDGTDEKQQTQLSALKRKYEAAETVLAAAQKFLKELPARTVDGDRRTWEEAAKAILSELTLDTASRLEKFVEYAELAERDRKEGKTPVEGPAALMARAVNNWLLANTSPAKPEEGVKLWKTRQFILEYQKTTNAGNRARMLSDYEKSSAVAFDEMAQLITLLPPPEPEEKWENGVVEMETKAQVGKRKGGVPYLLQLPPEYKHGRPYPVLFVLHQVNEKPKDFLEKWSELAAQHGYMLVAPDWTNGGTQRMYRYTAEEHAAVLETLKDLSRRFNVDSDRVFMAGYGEGGAMAYDVGLSHPDLFAGIMPMASPPRLFAAKYWANALHLPMYVVAGDFQSGDCGKIIRRQFESLVSRGAPALYVEYKGRGLEWFDAEMANFFDWMGRKKRLIAFPEATEFQSMRTTDARFYWLSGEEINSRHLNDARGFRDQTLPATLTGKIVEGNQIVVKANGYKQMTIWIGRGMVDFEKPVSIQVNLNLRVRERKLTPSLGTLLEDFYERNDRQRLFLVKIVIPV
ncbi:MAG: hypothetical protein K2R98_06885 [Gemmataceae bacterium]|nr:hypothetical protein [Gemmataceae bacterium]